MHFRVGILVILMCLGSIANARDTERMISIEEALGTADAYAVLSEGVALYWGDQSYPTPRARHGEYVSNRKTNAINKSDLGACHWVFLSAVRALQSRAYKEGGNAVVNIRSYYKRREKSSQDVYECHVGNVIAGVALKGEVVTLP